MLEPFKIQCESQSQDLYLFFGGLYDRRSCTPPFEFARSTQNLEAKKIYVRDPHQLWYQAGFPGISANIEESAKYLELLIAEHSPGRVITCGNSMGGYAAIQFGRLINANEVHAFSPRTVISPMKRLIRGDIGIRAALFERNPFLIKKLWALHKLPGTHSDYLDLRRTLCQSNDVTNYHIYYASGSRSDKLHAERLKRLPNVQIHSFPHDKHDLVASLKREGKLLETILNAG